MCNQYPGAVDPAQDTVAVALIHWVYWKFWRRSGAIHDRASREESRDLRPTSNLYWAICGFGSMLVATTNRRE